MSSLADLTQQALSLPIAARIQPAQQLWASLDVDGGESLADESSVVDLAQKRDRELDANPDKGIPHDEAMRRVRKSLRCE